MPRKYDWTMENLKKVTAQCKPVSVDPPTPSMSTEEMVEVLDSYFSNVDENVGKLESSMDHLSHQIGGIDERVVNLESEFKSISNKLENLKFNVKSGSFSTLAKWLDDDTAKSIEAQVKQMKRVYSVKNTFLMGTRGRGTPLYFRYKNNLINRSRR